MRLIPLMMVTMVLAACASTTPSTAPSTQLAPSDTASAVQRIDAAYARWRSAVESADIPGYVSVLHPDVRLFPPGAPVIAGADNYAAFLGPVFESATYRIEVVQMPAIEVFGEFAMVEYEYIIHLSLKDPSTGVTEPGALTGNRTRAQYFDVLRKTVDGDWGVWRHTWRSMPD